MSAATTYATAIADAKAIVPAEFQGPGGRLKATVTETGDCQLTVDGSAQIVAPAAALLAFAAWVNATFG